MTRLMIVLTLLFILMVNQPAHAQMALGPGMYDQLVPQIEYLDITWTTSADALNFGGSRTGTGLTTSTPRIRFYIWGDSLTVYITRTASGANGNVCINGLCTGVTWFSASTTYASITFSGLGYTPTWHEVIIQKTSVTNTAINLDAVYVGPPAPQPTTIPPTPIVVITMIYPTPNATHVVNIGNWAEATIEVEATDDPSITRFDVMDSMGNEQSVMVSYAIDAGQILIVIISTGSLVMLMIIMILLVRKQT